jgi:hypothetical protein
MVLSNESLTTLAAPPCALRKPCISDANDGGKRETYLKGPLPCKLLSMPSDEEAGGCRVGRWLRLAHKRSADDRVSWRGELTLAVGVLSRHRGVVLGS